MSADQDILSTTSRPTDAGAVAPAPAPAAALARTPPLAIGHSAELLVSETQSPVPSSPSLTVLSEEKTTKTTTASAFPSIPTVWIEDENSEEVPTSPVWYAPTCVSDFDLAWVEFVMQQYYENNFKDKDVKKPTVRRFTVDMAGAPDEKASKGDVILQVCISTYIHIRGQLRQIHNLRQDFL